MSTVATDPIAVLPETEEEIIGLEHAGTLMTLEEFDALEEVDELYVYELIGGRLVVSPPPLAAERGPNEELGYNLLDYSKRHPQGSALSGTLHEHTIHTPDKRRRADRVIWAGLGRNPDPLNDLPTIVVEFVSRSRRDRLRDYVEKRDEYLLLGIREYWIIDRFRRTLTVFRPGAPDIVVTQDGTYQTPFLPGFELVLARLLAVADRWSV